MSHHTATLQSASATAFGFACAVANRLYWLDDNYVQPFYTWAAPRLRDVAISGLYWGLVALIDVALWLINTTQQFMARDAQAIALSAFAMAHAPLPEFPALAPAAVPVPLALPFALPMDPSPSTELTAGNDVDRVIIIYPTVMPLTLRQFLNSNDSIRDWLTSALPLVPSLALVDDSVAEAVLVLPLVAEVAPVAIIPVPKSRKTKKNNIAGTTDAMKIPRKRSQRTTAKAR